MILLLLLTLRLFSFTTAHKCHNYEPCLNADGECNPPDYKHQNMRNKPFCSEDAGKCVDMEWCYDITSTCECGHAHMCRDQVGKCVQYDDWWKKSCPKGAATCQALAKQQPSDTKDTKSTAPEESAVEKNDTDSAAVSDGNGQSKNVTDEPLNKPTAVPSSTCRHYSPCQKKVDGEYVCNEPNYTNQNTRYKPFCSEEAGSCVNKDWCYDKMSECECGDSNQCRDQEGKCVPYADWWRHQCPEGSATCQALAQQDMPNSDNLVASSNCKSYNPCVKKVNGVLACYEPDYSHPNVNQKPFCSEEAGVCMNLDWCYDKTSKCECGNDNQCQDGEGKCIQYADWWRKECPEGADTCDAKKENSIASGNPGSEFENPSPTPAPTILTASSDKEDGKADDDVFSDPSDIINIPTPAPTTEINEEVDTDAAGAVDTPSGKAPVVDTTPGGEGADSDSELADALSEEDSEEENSQTPGDNTFTAIEQPLNNAETTTVQIPSCRRLKACWKQDGNDGICTGADYKFPNKKNRPFCSAKNGKCTNPDWCYDFTSPCECGGFAPCRAQDGKCVRFIPSTNECPKEAALCPP